MKENQKEITAYIGLTLMTIIIGLSFIFVKKALKYAPPIDLLAHRFTAATIGLLVFYTFSKKKKPNINKSSLPSLLLLSLFYPILLFSMQTIGLKYTTASEGGIISAAAPIITLVLASIFLKEKNSLWQIFSVILSVVGIMYIMYRNGVSSIYVTSLRGNVFILFSVIAMSIYFVLGRKITQKISAMDVTFFMTITACIVFNVIAVSSHIYKGSISLYFDSFKNTEFLISILYLGVLSSFLTSFLTNNALTVIPASKVAIFNNLSPIITVFAGVLFLNETLYSYHILGGLMVVIGVLGVNLFKNK